MDGYLTFIIIKGEKLIPQAFHPYFYIVVIVKHIINRYQVF